MDGCTSEGSRCRGHGVKRRCWKSRLCTRRGMAAPAVPLHQEQRGERKSEVQQGRPRSIVYARPLEKRDTPDLPNAAYQLAQQRGLDMHVAQLTYNGSMALGEKHRHKAYKQFKAGKSDTSSIPGHLPFLSRQFGRSSVQEHGNVSQEPSLTLPLAVVRPFGPHDFEALLSQLNGVPTADGGVIHCASPRSDVDLLLHWGFAASDSPARAVDTWLQNKAAWAMRSMARCFRGVALVTAGLSAAHKFAYPQAPCLQFHSFMLDAYLLRPYSAIFVMEPDTRPLRAHWLDYLVSEARDLMASAHWYRGPSYDNAHTLLPHRSSPPEKMFPNSSLWNVHPNGNAFYRSPQNNKGLISAALLPHSQTASSTATSAAASLQRGGAERVSSGAGADTGETPAHGTPAAAPLSWFCSTRQKSFYDVAIFKRLQQQGLAHRAGFTELVAHAKSGAPSPKWDPRLTMRAARERYPRAMLFHGRTDCATGWCNVAAGRQMEEFGHVPYDQRVEVRLN